MSNLTLKAEALSLGYRDSLVIRDLSLTVPAGKNTAILGPNGCGKSTLLRGLGRLLRPRSGRVLLAGRDIHAMNTRALARQLAILPQAPLAPEGVSVGELVRRGRTPWRGLLTPWSRADAQGCAAALEAVAMTDLANRPLAELSGGQRQRAWLALVLAQEAPILLLDEPTTFLDLTHQLEVLALLRTLNREQGTTVISVLHDLNLAARFSDHIILFGKDGLVAEGAPETVVSEGNLKRAFGLDARVQPDPETGRPMVIPR